MNNEHDHDHYHLAISVEEATPFLLLQIKTLADLFDYRMVSADPHRTGDIILVCNHSKVAALISSEMVPELETELRYVTDSGDVLQYMVDTAEIPTLLAVSQKLQMALEQVRSGDLDAAKETVFGSVAGVELVFGKKPETETKQQNADSTPSIH